MKTILRFLGFGRQKHKPNILVDFKMIDEVLYLVIINASIHPAYQVCNSFSSPIHGYNGTQKINELKMVKDLPYLAPFKSISIFIDPKLIFFQNLTESVITIETHFKDDEGCKHSISRTHDLSAYQQIPTNSQVDFLI